MGGGAEKGAIEAQTVGHDAKKMKKTCAIVADSVQRGALWWVALKTKHVVEWNVGAVA